MSFTSGKLESYLKQNNLCNTFEKSLVVEKTIKINISNFCLVFKIQLNFFYT